MASPIWNCKMLFMEDSEDTMGHKDFFPFRWVVNPWGGDSRRRSTARSPRLVSRIPGFFVVALEKFFIGCSPGSHPDKSDLDIVDII